jgi:hypothetical protein
MYSKPSPPAESDGQACEGPNSCQSVGSPTFAFLNMIKRLTQLCHYSVLENGDPLEMILSHLQYDHALLAKLLEVCPFLYAAGIKILWHRCVSSADRQHYFASLIGRVHLFDHKVIRPSKIFD